MGHHPTQETPSADYIVVGGGSAGAAVAARLSENGRFRVVLLEAGGSDKAQQVAVPAAFSQMFRSARDWNYDTTPQPGLDGRTVYWPRGKMLGGSSSINAMMWVRGFAADYDGWGSVAGPGWSFDGLLPYFRKVESVQASSDPDHGQDGALRIERQRDPRRHTAAFLEAVRAAGYPVGEANSREPGGFSETMVTQRRGARMTTSGAYLAAARSRRNLDIRTGAHVTGVEFDGTRAVAVRYRQHGVDRTCRAGKEIVLSGGAVNTPQLLQLSGVGAAASLRALGIDVVVDSPDVGANLQDHLVAFLVPEALGGTLLDATKPSQLVRYLAGRKGMLTSNVAEAYGFITVGAPDDGHANIEMIFAPAAYVDEGLAGIPGHGITMGAILLQPESHGTVALQSADPFEKPIIDPRYLSDPDGHDMATLLAGLAVCDDVLTSPSLKELTTGRFMRPPGGERMTPEERCLSAVRQYAHTLYHPTSTARMGSDAGSVVDPELRVRGVSGLRVADASVMPKIIRGHTNAPSIVIGEKAADLLLADA